MASKKPAAQLGVVSGRLDVNASPTRNGFVEAILTSSGRRISHLSADGLPSSFITRPWGPSIRPSISCLRSSNGQNLVMVLVWWPESGRRLGKLLLLTAILCALLRLQQKITTFVHLFTKYFILCLNEIFWKFFFCQQHMVSQNRQKLLSLIRNFLVGKIYPLCGL